MLSTKEDPSVFEKSNSIKIPNNKKSENLFLVSGVTQVRVISSLIDMPSFFFFFFFFFGLEVSHNKEFKLLLGNYLTKILTKETGLRMIIKYYLDFFFIRVFSLSYHDWVFLIIVYCFHLYFFLKFRNMEVF